MLGRHGDGMWTVTSWEDFRVFVEVGVGFLQGKGDSNLATDTF